MPKDVKQSLNRDLWGSYGQRPGNHPKPIENTKIHSCSWRSANQKSRRKTDLTREQDPGGKVKFMFLAVLGLWPTAFHWKLMGRLVSGDPSIY